MTTKTTKKRIQAGLQAIALSCLMTGAPASIAAARSAAPTLATRVTTSTRTATTGLAATRLPTVTRPAPAPTTQTLRCAKPAYRGHLRPRWTPAKSTASAYRVTSERMRLVLKLQDDACAKAQNGTLLTSSDRNLQLVASTIEKYAPNARVVRRFSNRDGELEEARAAGEARIGQRLADLRQYYWIELDQSWHMPGLIGQLIRLSAVETVYAQSQTAPDPGDITSPTTPNFSDELDFWAPAPEGLDIDFALAEDDVSNGEMGNASMIADIESGWNFNHEDLSVKGPNMLYSIGSHGTGDANATTDHGSAVAGLIVADSDAPGIRGIASGAGYLAVPSRVTGGFDDTAQAVIDVAIPGGNMIDNVPTSRLGANGIILVEKQVFGPNPATAADPQFGTVAPEYQQAEFDAIRMATALGVTVIEAAGNGSQDFDDRSASSDAGDPTYNRFDRRVRDSGAILVTQATSQAPHAPRNGTNRGRRIDLYSWGEDIFTLGYGSNGNTTPLTDGFPAGDFDINQRYTNDFGGSSGATAIVTGIAAILETNHFMAHHGHGRVRHVDPLALRLMLRTTGTDSQAPATDQIGRQPDLREQLPLIAMGPNIASVFSESPGADAGSAIAPIADLDGDEIGEIIVGSPGAATVHVYSGASGDRIVEFLGASGSRFGASVAAIDDVTGDGLQEIVIGAPNEGTGGAAYVYSFTSPNAPQRTYLSSQSGAQFGRAVASLGASSSYGNPRVLVGAPGASRVHAYDATQSGSPIWTKQGGANTDFGATIVTGDVVSFAGNGSPDGQVDILIGAPRDPNGMNGPSGRVFLYQNGGQLHRIYAGSDAWSQFGTSIAVIGDRDGDGIDDFAVGSPGTESNRGAVDIYSGQTSGLVQFKMGPNGGLNFGASVAGPGDLDGDGIVDLLVGVPYAGGSNGQVQAIALGDSGSTPLAAYTGESTGDWLGSSLSIVGDIDSDGQVEFVAGAPASDRDGEGSGAAYLFLLPEFGY